jgi:hypothetical protein
MVQSASATLEDNKLKFLLGANPYQNQKPLDTFIECMPEVN